MDVKKNAVVVERIKAVAKAKGIKLVHLTNEIGMTRSYFGDVSREKCSVSSENLHKIAKKLDVSIEFLLDDSIPIESSMFRSDLPSEFLDVMNELYATPNGNTYINALLDRAKQMLAEEKAHQEKIKKLL